MIGHKSSYNILSLLNKGNDSLSKIFGNVFRIVFQLFNVMFFLVFSWNNSRLDSGTDFVGRIVRNVLNLAFLWLLLFKDLLKVRINLNFPNQLLLDGFLQTIQPYQRTLKLEKVRCKWVLKAKVCHYICQQKNINEKLDIMLLTGLQCSKY